MASELQRLVDNLGRRLGRSVAIDDPDIHLLAYNSHAGDVDEVRIESIMRRQVSRELVDYIHSRGALDVHDLLVIDAKPELGVLLPRMLMPIRYGETLLGFLWLMLSDGPVTQAQADAVRKAAEQAAIILHREYLIGEMNRGLERELVRDLISGDPHVHEDAADRLIEEELITAGPIVVLVVMLGRERDELSAEQDRLALAACLDYGRRRLPPRSAIQLDRPDHAILVIAGHGPSSSTEIDELADAMCARIRAEYGSAVRDCWIGIGEPRPRLAEAHESYREALRAATVASVIRALGLVVRYTKLGIYGLLAELSPQRLASNLHPGIQRLLDHDSGNDSLVDTLEVFLDSAGSAQRAAERLCIHRASLYYRLRRIQEITETDLSTGDDRLALHLSLKAARLIELR